MTKRKVSIGGKDNRCYLQRPCRVCGKIPEEGYSFSQYANSAFTCLSCRRKQKLEKLWKTAYED